MEGIVYRFAEPTEKEGIFSLAMVWWDDTFCQRYAASDYVRGVHERSSGGMHELLPFFEK
jgi:hypothetical protein